MRGWHRALFATAGGLSLKATACAAGADPELSDKLRASHLLLDGCILQYEFHPMHVNSLIYVIFQLKCGNCGEVSEKWQYLRLMDSAPLKGGRGSATMVQKCKLCSRENSIDILSQTIKPYNAEDSEKFKTIVEFECRGLEPVDFQPQAGFAAEGAESGTPFNDINLLEKDWNDYDEKTKESVGIYEVTHKFVKC
uniref:CXXC motif containing zinc binding protein n=1 Tax=Phasianus colchicus TaxID=9054 RepID=A0A669PAI3_PHACC